MFKKQQKPAEGAAAEKVLWLNKMLLKSLLWRRNTDISSFLVWIQEQEENSENQLSGSCENLNDTAVVKVPLSKKKLIFSLCFYTNQILWDDTVVFVVSSYHTLHSGLWCSFEKQSYVVLSKK